MAVDLTDKQWPEPTRRIGHELKDAQPDAAVSMMLAEGADYLRSAYLQEGHVQCRVLGRRGVSRPIAAEECAITSLVALPDGRVFGATSGRRAHLFLYSTHPGVDWVQDLGVLGEETRVRHALAVGGDGTVYAGTRPKHGAGSILAHDPQRTSVALYGRQVHRTESRVVLPDGDGVACLAGNGRSDVLAGLAEPSGRLFTFAPATAELRMGPAVSEGSIRSEVIVMAADGAVYGAARGARLFRYDVRRNEVEYPGARVPALAGRAMYDTLRSAVVDDAAGVLYGGTADGVLFMYPLGGDRTLCLGKPCARAGIPCLSLGSDGVLYGVGGCAGGMAHLFRYDPTSGDLRDLGVPLAACERFWHGYEFDCACTGRSGEIYLGESDRVSHLFIYYPPIRPATTRAAGA